MSWLDFKLAARMLVKYPGLTAVGGIAIAVAIAICVAFFDFWHDLNNPTLPLDEGNRVVAVENWNVATNNPERRSLHDFSIWRKELTSVEDLGAFSTLEWNLITDDGRGEPVKVAEISSSAFRVARVPPLLGRPLIDGDEQEGAPAVAVVGYGLWQSRFGGDSGVVGRTVRLGNDRHTIVGVMPEGFAFPVSHRLWIPLRVPIYGVARLHGPPIRTFGRLAPGTTIEAAQAELTAIGTRATANAPLTTGELAPRVLPYSRSFVDPDMDQGLAYALQSVLLMILVVCSANVATLVFARTPRAKARSW